MTTVEVDSLKSVEDKVGGLTVKATRGFSVTTDSNGWETENIEKYLAIQ